jgi:hypothetical protein
MGSATSYGLEERIAVLRGARLAGRRDWQDLADVAVVTRAARMPSGVLVDVRGLTALPSVRDADQLAWALARYPLVALVSGPDASYGCARMVVAGVEYRGGSAAAFQDVAEAWLWLGEHLEMADTDMLAAPRRTFTTPDSVPTTPHPPDTR